MSLSRINRNPLPWFTSPWAYKSKVPSIQVEPNPVTSTMPITDGFISDSQLEDMKRHFTDKGFLLWKKFIHPNIIDNCSNHFHNICIGAVDSDPRNVVRDQYNRCVEIKNIHSDAVFSELIQGPENILEYIFGPQTCVHSKIINRLPGKLIESPRRHIIDAPDIPVSESVIIWTAMDEKLQQNGTHFVVPGTHNDQLYQLDPSTMGNNDYIGTHRVDEIIPEYRREYIVMEKGDTLFIHPKLVHGVDNSHHSEIPSKATHAILQTKEYTVLSTPHGEEWKSISSRKANRFPKDVEEQNYIPRSNL